MSPECRKYNQHHASVRQVIERLFGIFVLRFPRMVLITSLNRSRRILMANAAAVLHNICIMEDDNDEEGLMDAIRESAFRDVLYQGINVPPFPNQAAAQAAARAAANNNDPNANADTPENKRTFLKDLINS